MKSAIVSLIGLICLLMLSNQCLAAEGGEDKDRENERDGYFELTLKTPDSKKITIPDVVRDRDLNPKAIFRRKTGGYISFEDADWIDRIEFKVSPIPVHTMPEYRKFARVLVDINQNLSRISDSLTWHDKFSMRLMNLCDKSAFNDLKAIDQNIVQQLEIYRSLILLRALVVNSLNRFVKDRSCVDKYKEYSDQLNRAKKDLTEICGRYEALKDRALSTALEKERPGDKSGQQDPPDDGR